MRNGAVLRNPLIGDGRGLRSAVLTHGRSLVRICRLVGGTRGGGMARLKQVRALGLVLVVAALIAGACSSSKSSGGTKANTSSGGSSSGSVHQGGDIVVAADQEPDCMDWIGSCAGSSWGAWIAAGETMPHPPRYTNSAYPAAGTLTGA